MNGKQHQGGEGLKELGADDARAMLTTGDGEASGAGADDDQEGGTTGAASMTGGDHRGARSPEGKGSAAAAAASPAGGRESSAADQLGEIGMSSARPGPMGSGGGDETNGQGGGSIGTGTYNQAGNVTGPDSPGGGTTDGAGGEGQGDDLANRLGGGGGSGSGLTGAAAVSGDRSAGRSETTSRPATAGYTPDAGAPGGMGGVRGPGKAPGGVSPILTEEEGGPGQ